MFRHQAGDEVGFLVVRHGHKSIHLRKSLHDQQVDIGGVSMDHHDIGQLAREQLGPFAIRLDEFQLLVFLAAQLRSDAGADFGAAEDHHPVDSGFTFAEQFSHMWHVFGLREDKHLIVFL